MIDHGDTKQTFERSAIAAAVISFVAFAVGAASAAGGWLGGATVTIVALVAGAASLLVAHIAWRLRLVRPLSDPAQRESVIRRNGRSK